MHALYYVKQRVSPSDLVVSDVYNRLPMTSLPSTYFRISALLVFAIESFCGLSQLIIYSTCRHLAQKIFQPLLVIFLEQIFDIHLLGDFSGFIKPFSC